MKKMIGKALYDTDAAKCLGYKYSGEYGRPEGYEEQLYVTDTGQYFICGIGGMDSPYIEPAIRKLTPKQADEWKKANNIGL